MARALAVAYGGAAAAAGFVPPWLTVLGVALLSVWAITLTVLLCGDSSDADGPKRPTSSGAAAVAAAVAVGAASGASAGTGGGGGGGGGGCGGGGGGVC